MNKMPTTKIFYYKNRNPVQVHEFMIFAIDGVF